jgi:hypothetical protein
MEVCACTVECVPPCSAELQLIYCHLPFLRAELASVHILTCIFSVLLILSVKCTRQADEVPDLVSAEMDSAANFKEVSNNAHDLPKLSQPGQ